MLFSLLKSILFLKEEKERDFATELGNISSQILLNFEQTFGFD